jgi:predicted component of type VI protein secretion system
MFGSDPGRLGTTTRPLVALVTIVDTDSERMFSRTFAASPIRIGSHRTSDLHLRHPQVARCHGEISFEPGCACFLNRAWSKRTSVDDWRLARGEAVWLTEWSVIALGPFRIDVSLCKPRLRDAERSRKVTPLVLPCVSIAALDAAAAPPPDPVLASFLRLARVRTRDDESAARAPVIRESSAR